MVSKLLVYSSSEDIHISNLQKVINSVNDIENKSVKKLSEEKSEAKPFLLLKEYMQIQNIFKHNIKQINPKGSIFKS